jgi:hypothetical protein
MWPGNVNLKHGYSRVGIYNSTYRAWASMKNRCHAKFSSKNYKYYAGKGIRICERWIGRQGFQNFLSDMGPKPGRSYSLDRIDSDGNYEPSNCRWATKIQQSRNRTYSSGSKWAWESHAEAVG